MLLTYLHNFKCNMHFQKYPEGTHVDTCEYV